MISMKLLLLVKQSQSVHNAYQQLYVVVLYSPALKLFFIEIYIIQKCRESRKKYISPHVQALAIIMVEKFFSKVPRVARKMERFYVNIVEESLFGKDPDVAEDVCDDKVRNPLLSTVFKTSFALPKGIPRDVSYSRF